MRTKTGVALALIALCSTLGATPGRAAPSSQTRVLVLYDDGGAWGNLGAEYATMLRNLLGHFPVVIDAAPVSTYDAYRTTRYTETFYIGSTYDDASTYAAGSREAQSYADFLADVATGMPTTWFGYNLWSMAWNWDASWGTSSFAQRFGFAFDGLSDQQFNRVRYKGVDLDKAVLRATPPGSTTAGCTAEPDTGFEDCATWVGATHVTDTTVAFVPAEAVSTVTGASAPYAVHGGSLWYVADMPFTYISELDRYLAIADLLHDMLGMPGSQSHTALVRLEDVGPDANTNDLLSVKTALDGLNVPFSVATIPYYEDPTGYYNNGQPQDLKMSGSAVGKLLKQFQSDGATIVQHGTTHQWAGGPNPYDGVTGDDFEFYRVTEQPDHALNFVGPIPGDSTRWATDRVKKGQAELKKAGITPFAFEVPHYTASATDFNAIHALYPVYYGRAVYFPSTDGRFVGQFFPYVVRDVYGQTVIPEDLGDISPTAWNGYPASLPEDLIARARAASVVRDGVASFFFHPYLDVSLLQKTIRGIRDLGYTFVAPCSLIGCASPKRAHTTARTRVRGGTSSGARTVTPGVMARQAAG